MHTIRPESFKFYSQNLLKIFIETLQTVRSMLYYFIGGKKKTLKIQYIYLKENKYWLICNQGK